jgi:hypothetical protein
MAIRIITVEREYGSGGAKIAELLAAQRGWKLWDTNLTAEIARRADVDPHAAELCDERCDPLLHRLFKVFARGSYERSLPVADAPGLDTDHMVALLHRVIEDAASSGNCVIVGRGSPGCFSRIRIRIGGGKNASADGHRQKRERRGRAAPHHRS